MATTRGANDHMVVWVTDTVRRVVTQTASTQVDQPKVMRKQSPSAQKKQDSRGSSGAGKKSPRP